MRKTSLSGKKGFTLLEVLLVIAIIAILAGIVILALNIGKQLAAARNAERSSSVNTVLNAVYQYALDNDGSIPASITTTETEICSNEVADCSGLIDLSDLTLNEEYIVGIPVDPRAVTANGAGYTIKATANGRVQVNAPIAEYGAVISVTR